MTRRLFAEISLGSLVANYRRVRAIVGGRQVIAVVKADAYGHGAVEIARKLEAEGADAFGVATVGEGAELRESGITRPIIVFFDNDHIEDYLRYHLTPVVFDPAAARAFSKAARASGNVMSLHVKIDTGMGRVGFLPEDALDAVEAMRRLDGIRIAGLMSHFSEADLRDRSFAEEQMARFSRIISSLRAGGLEVVAHIANSAAVMELPGSYLDAVRPGLMLYGYSPFPGEGGLHPVMQMKTRLIDVRNVPAGTPISYARTFVTRRPSRIGVIPVGYADGLFRSFSNNGEVLIRGKRVPVVGRVCMDLTMVDLTGSEDVGIGDEAILLSAERESALTAEELAGRAGTISYEILTSMGMRARRVYVD